MDCDLARHLLAFQRPGELDAADVSALARHLAACPACAALTRHDQAFDRAVGAAVHAVPVPSGGRSRAAARVAAVRGAQVRRQLGAVFGATAGLVLAVGIGGGVYARNLPVFDSNIAASESETVLEEPQAAVRAWFVERGVPAALPADFDFGRYFDHGAMPVLGKDVPAVTFVLPNPDSPRVDFARVYVVTRGRFNLADIRAAHASVRHVTVLADPAHPQVRWVVVHTTPTLEPFLRKVSRLET